MNWCNHCNHRATKRANLCPHINHSECAMRDKACARLLIEGQVEFDYTVLPELTWPQPQKV